MWLFDVFSRLLIDVAAALIAIATAIVALVCLIVAAPSINTVAQQLDPLRHWNTKRGTLLLLILVAIGFVYADSCRTFEVRVSPTSVKSSEHIEVRVSRG